MTSEIVPTSNSIEFLQDVVDLDPNAVKAQMTFQTGKIPTDKIHERPGAYGKMLKYVSHVYATEAIQKGLLPIWSLDTLDYNIHDDKSATALVRFSYSVPYRNDSGAIIWLPRTSTQTGAFDNKAGMCHAYAIRAAESRGLVNCLMRMFGFGIEFYDSASNDMTPDHAWAVASEFAKKFLKLTQDDAKQAKDEIGINPLNIVDRFSELIEHMKVVAEAKQIALGQPSPAQQSAPVQQPNPVPVVEEPTMEQTIEAEVKTETVVYDSWDKVNEWLDANKIDKSDAQKILKEAFPNFDVAQCPTYQKFLAEKYNI